MTAELLTHEKNIATFKITIPDADFDNAIEQAYRQSKHKINIQGFRKGKAPRKIIEKYYGETVFYEDALDIVLPKAYDNAVDELKLEPVGKPEVDSLEIMERPIVVSVKVVTKPPVTLGQYKGIEADKLVRPITDAQIDEEIDKKRKANARIVDVEVGPTIDGDKVTIDYKGLLDGVAFDGGTAENYDLEIGSNTFIPGFEPQLIGKNVGDSFSIDVTFPEEYHNADLAGKPVVFEINLKGIKRRELAELDDEFAKDISEFDTLAEYRASIKADLEKKEEQRSTEECEDALFDKILNNCEVEIPQAMIDMEADNMVEGSIQRFTQYGMPRENIFKMFGTDEATMRKDFIPNATKNVKYRLVLEAIIKELDMQATDEDVENEYAELAKEYNVTVEFAKERLNVEEVKSRARNRKTMQFIKDSAIITEKTVNPDESKEA